MVLYGVVWPGVIGYSVAWFIVVTYSGPNVFYDKFSNFKIFTILE